MDGKANRLYSHFTIAGRVFEQAAKLEAKMPTRTIVVTVFGFIFELPTRFY